MKHESAIYEALDAALHSAREARQRTHVALDLLAPKIVDNEHAGYAVVSLVDIFTEICGAYALIHEMMKPCLEISGVDLSPVLAAAARERGGARRTPTAAARSAPAAADPRPVFHLPYRQNPRPADLRTVEGLPFPGGDEADLRLIPE